MSKFEKEYEYLRLEIGNTDRLLGHCDVVNKFKDWQPPKPKVKLPQFVANWVEYCKDDGLALSYMMSCGGNENFNRDILNWMCSAVGNDELLARAWFDGYTVDEDKDVE